MKDLVPNAYTMYFNNYISMESINLQFRFEHSSLLLLVCKAYFRYVFEICPFNIDSVTAQ